MIKFPGVILPFVSFFVRYEYNNVPSNASYDDARNHKTGHGCRPRSAAALVISLKTSLNPTMAAAAAAQNK